jgi:hypothetical protein
MGAINRTVYQGDSLPISVEVFSTGTAIFDLTGYEARVEVVPSDDCSPITLYSTSGDLTIDTTAGTIDGAFSGEQTELFEVGRHTNVNLIFIDPSTLEETVQIMKLTVRE